MTQHFTFFESYYMAVKELDNAIKAEYYDVLFEYALYSNEPGEDASPIVKALFIAIKPNLDKSKARRIAGAKGGSKTKDEQSKNEANGKQNEANGKQTPTDKEKEKEKEKDKEYLKKIKKENPTLNMDAIILWFKYKGKDYTKHGKTLSINKLKEFPINVQMEMVETSIMNKWKGLFEPKQKNNVSSFSKAQPGSLEWERLESIRNNQDVIDADVVQVVINA